MSGQFEVDLPAVDAIGLFTPEGERDWVPGWDPVYSTADASEAAGTVFTTDHGSVKTIWLILEVDRIQCKAAYALVTSGHHAGIVKVSCTDADELEPGIDVVESAPGDTFDPVFDLSDFVFGLGSLPVSLQEV